VAAAAPDLSSIGSTIGAANSTAAVQTTQVCCSARTPGDPIQQPDVENGRY
jgi:hypothetical protein